MVYLFWVNIGRPVVHCQVVWAGHDGRERGCHQQQHCWPEALALCSHLHTCPRLLIYIPLRHALPMHMQPGLLRSPRLPGSTGDMAGAKAHAMTVPFRCAEMAPYSAKAASEANLKEVLRCTPEGGYPSEYASPEPLRDAVNLFLYQLKGVNRSKALQMCASLSGVLSGKGYHARYLGTPQWHMTLMHLSNLRFVVTHATPMLAGITAHEQLIVRWETHRERKCLSSMAAGEGMGRLNMAVIAAAAAVGRSDWF